MSVSLRKGQLLCRSLTSGLGFYKGRGLGFWTNPPPECPELAYGRLRRAYAQTSKALHLYWVALAEHDPHEAIVMMGIDCGCNRKTESSAREFSHGPQSEQRLL